MKISPCSVGNLIYKLFTGKELHKWRVYHLYGAFDPLSFLGKSEFPGGKSSQVSSCCVSCGKTKHERLHGWYRYTEPGKIVPRKGFKDWPTAEENQEQQDLHRESQIFHWKNVNAWRNLKIS